MNPMTKKFKIFLGVNDMQVSKNMVGNIKLY